MDILYDSKNILIEYIQDKYKTYLNDKKILLIKENTINEEIDKIYDNNLKDIKSIIRSKLKEKYESPAIENIIMDLFINKEDNISKLCEELKILQKANYLEIEIPIINNSLNLNISIQDNYIKLNSIKYNILNENNVSNDDILKFEKIEKYSFLYSIDNKILEEYDDTQKLNIIKDSINNKNIDNKIKIGVYYLKKNCDN
tara:strand:- start:895 stop:1494 length:600 start_codon:yes stop_codon:yes gene_type:complete